MSRTALIILGIVLVVMGVLALIPSIEMITGPVWHTIAVLVVGVLAVVIGVFDKGKSDMGQSDMDQDMGQSDAGSSMPE